MTDDLTKQGPLSAEEWLAMIRDPATRWEPLSEEELQNFGDAMIQVGARLLRLLDEGIRALPSSPPCIAPPS